MRVKTENIRKAVLEKLGKKYRYIGALGAGTFSNVYLVRHTIFDEDHALKIMNSRHIIETLEKESVTDSRQKFDKIKKRFLNEAIMYKRIDNPNVAKIFDVDVVTDEIENIDIPYIIMSYIKGLHLRDVLTREAPLEFPRALDLSEGILSAIDAIHQKKIIHRDLKPDNIMVEEGTGNVILIDFGLAKDLLNATKLTTTGFYIGTPLYMAPEQFFNSSAVGIQTDIYAFGVVLFEMLAGEPPFDDDNVVEVMNGHCSKPVPDVREKNPALPGGVTPIIKKAMAKEAGNRYQSVGELLKDLETVG